MVTVIVINKLIRGRESPGPGSQSEYISAWFPMLAGELDSQHPYLLIAVARGNSGVADEPRAGGKPGVELLLPALWSSWSVASSQKKNHLILILRNWKSGSYIW